MKHLRAILVLLHVLVITVLSFPAPVGGMTKKAFADPVAQANFESYAGALRALGLDVEKAELETWLWENGNRLIALRRELVAPTLPYQKWTGAEQGWRMFGMVNRRPAWLVIEVQEGEAWRTVYRCRSDEFTWRREQFDQERMRAVVNAWSWRTRKPGYEQFGVWIAQKASVDFPQASHLRMHMQQVTLPPPETLHSQGMPEGKPFWEATFSLDKYR